MSDHEFIAEVTRNLVLTATERGDISTLTTSERAAFVKEVTRYIDANAEFGIEVQLIAAVQHALLHVNRDRAVQPLREQLQPVTLSSSVFGNAQGARSHAATLAC